MLKHGILGLLNYDDKTGYEIMTVFRDSLNHFWTAQTSQIYRELQTMEKRPGGSERPTSPRPANRIKTCTPSPRRGRRSWCAGCGTITCRRASGARC